MPCSLLAYLRGRGPAPEPPEVRTVAYVAKPYRCARCDVLGASPVGDDRVCWCCGEPDRLANR